MNAVQCAPMTERCRALYSAPEYLGGEDTFDFLELCIVTTYLLLLFDLYIQYQLDVWTADACNP